MAMGRADESIAMVKTAHQMDPLSSVLSASLGMILYLGRQYDESIGPPKVSGDGRPRISSCISGSGWYSQTDPGQQAIDEMKRASRCPAK